MLDMSKAFETVERNTLYDDLAEIVEPDELIMMNILLKDVVIQIRCGTTIGEEIQTNIGAPQGDCASALFSVLYLAQALKPKRDVITVEHKYSITTTTEESVPHHLTDYTYSMTKLYGYDRMTMV